MFHRIRLLISAGVLFSVLGAVTIYGFGYYRLPMPARILEGRHTQLKPSGSIGLRLGMFGVFLFGCLYLYPIRKRSKLLQRFGKTKHWLDFHVLFGISAPLFITLHSSFKLQGLAGIAYWIMIAVMLSGFVGRYFYGQIPRHMNAAALSLQELQELAAKVAADLSAQEMFSSDEVARLMDLPGKREIEEMSLARAVCLMMWLDIERPFRVASLRRHSMKSWGQKISTFGGLLPSSRPELEDAVRIARRHSWLLGKTAFLSRTSEVFRLWHVVHRPFSYSFAVLAVVHITVVLLMGFY